MATWPATLPALLQISGLSETPPNNVIRTKMEIGPAKMRRRSTSGPRPISGEQILTTAQVATLDTFYVGTLIDGTTAFDWTHPRTGAAVEMRFVSPPTYAPAGGDYWRVMLKLEILP